MAIIRIESIFTLRANELVPDDRRRRSLEFDDPNEFVNESDTHGPIHIRSGLRPNDVAIFLRFFRRRDEPSTEPLPKKPVGYLVSVVDNNPEGSGILVSGHHLEADPAAWVSPRIEQVWSLLSKDGHGPGATFELHCLDAYLKSKGLIA